MHIECQGIRHTGIIISEYDQDLESTHEDQWINVDELFAVKRNTKTLLLRLKLDKIFLIQINNRISVSSLFVSSSDCFFDSEYEIIYANSRV